MLNDEPRYTTSDAIFYTGLSADCLRRYEADGLLSPFRTARGTRLYRMSDLDLARRIYASRMARHGATGERRPVAAGERLPGT